MTLLNIVTLVAALAWIVIFIFARQFRKQFFWMGFLATLLIGGALMMNISWLEAAAVSGDYWQWLTQMLVLVFFIGSVSAIAYEAIFHVHWKRPAHKHHHHIGLLVISPLLVLLGFFIMPFAALHLLLIGIALEVVLLLIVRSDLVVDGLFSGLFMGTMLTTVFYYFFSTIPGTFFETWQLSGITLKGMPVELVFFFFLFGVLWGPWYEVMKDYHPRKVT